MEIVSMDDFQSLQVIGEGAFGKVCMVKQVRRQENYALKVISKASCVKTKRTRHVVRERMLLEQLDHPLVCNLRYAFQDEHNLYMAMDLMLGGDLRRCIDQNGPLPENLTRFWMTELICAVKYLHSKGIMHRDIKPENLLLHSDGHLHLTDFNIATRIRRPYDGLLTSLSGTLVYFAPELVKGYGYTEDVDWWGVGITFYECIYGKRPWREREGKDDILNQIVRGHIPYPMLADGTVSMNCLSVLQGFLETNPTYRLGHGTNGWEQLLQHPFFGNVCWQDFNKKQGIPPSNINLQHYISSTLLLSDAKNHTTITPPAISTEGKSELLQLSTIASSPSLLPSPASSRPSHCASSTSSSICKNNNFRQQQDGKDENEGWLAAAYDYFLAPSPAKPQNNHDLHGIMHDDRYTQQIHELEAAFTLFDWTMYDDYQGLMDKTTFSVGSPPSWVKPAFNDADNGRVLPMPTISTDLPILSAGATTTTCDDDTLMTPPTTPISAGFPPVFGLVPHDDYPTPNAFTSHQFQPQQQLQQKPMFRQPSLKKRRRSSTKYFNERRDWERRKSMGTAAKLANIG
ncbi:kinase-like domain-containing protein [Absidia repens]|uniref:non-specific serine/threonine protein kinase n=1 Tax=Absidia repens TaxID=90262 RepID=A0A1X2ILI9_9FUNG|nr:kinase-like domain-containing protein [Absidia repens]